MLKYTSESELRNSLFKSPFDLHLDKENRWIILEKLVPWDAFAQKLRKEMSELGRGCIDLRYAIGAILIKGIEDLSDEATIGAIQENIYMQYFVGLRSFQPNPLFTPEVFVSIRKRLGEKSIKEMNDTLLQHCQKEKYLQHRKRYVTEEEKQVEGLDGANEQKVEEFEKAEKGSKHTNRGVLMADATVCPQDISYPVDIRLLHKARLILEQVIDVYHAKGLFGEKKPRTYRRNAKKAYLNVAKKKRPSKKRIRKGIKQQLQYIRRDFKYIDSLYDEMSREGKGFPQLDKALYRKLLVVREVYRQQKEMYEDRRKRIDDRIVNIAQPYVRPIVRGKAGKKTEFGAKLNITETEGYLRMDRVDFNNFNESTGFQEQIEGYKELYGYYPASVLVDKIYLTRENRKYLKENEIEHYGPRLGRSKKWSKEEKRKRKKKQNKRSRIEGQFGLAKRKYGLDNIKMRREDTSKCQIGLIILSMNILRMLQDAFLPIFSYYKSKIRAYEERGGHKISFYVNQWIKKIIIGKRNETIPLFS